MWWKTQHHFTEHQKMSENPIYITNHTRLYYTLCKTKHNRKKNITCRKHNNITQNTTTLKKTQQHYTKCIITTGNTMTWLKTQTHDTKHGITQNKTTLCKTQLNCILMCGKLWRHILLMGILNKRAWHKMTLVATRIEKYKWINMN